MAVHSCFPQISDSTFSSNRSTVPAPPSEDRERFDFKTHDAYEFFQRAGTLANATEKYFKQGDWLWNDQVRHDTYDDYWKARNLAPHMHNIKCAVMTVGGWFDAEGSGRTVQDLPFH